MSYELLLKGGSKGEYSNIGPRWLLIHEYSNEAGLGQEPKTGMGSNVRPVLKEERHDCRDFKLCSKFGEKNVPL
jgi:hypothetical protein